MTSGACSTDFGTVNESGTVTLSTTSTITVVAGAVWNLTTDGGHPNTLGNIMLADALSMFL